MPPRANKLEIETFLSLYFPLNVNLKQIYCNISPETIALPVFARGEDSITENVYNFPEKCRADPDLFEKVI